MLKVGELAERTQLSVRTLHYYEEIGLLIPSHRTQSGHLEKYYSQEQLKELEARRIALGEESMKKAQQDWQDLFADIRAASARGADPKGEEGAKLMERHHALIFAFTGGNAGIERSLGNLVKSEGKMMEGFGLDPVIKDFLDRTLK